MTFRTQPSSFLKASYVSLFYSSFDKDDLSSSLSLLLFTLKGINLLVKSKAFQYAMCKCHSEHSRCSLGDKISHHKLFHLTADVVVAINGVWILVETYKLNSKIICSPDKHMWHKESAVHQEVSPLSPPAGGFSWSRFVPWSYIVFLTSELAAAVSTLNNHKILIKGFQTDH